MKTNETCPSTSKVQLSTSQNIAEELENILLRMLYRISQEDMHVADNVGHAA